MSIRAGRLNKRIELQREDATKDEYGSKAAEWVTVDYLWAEIAPLRGRELFAAHQVHAEVTHKVTVRQRPDLTSEMRFKYGARAFNIATMPMNVREGNESIEMMCVEVEGVAV